ncbi:glycoside hydrolase family 13 protein [Pontibacillus litoralis]|uniref:Glycosyl hydrolase family 13 catalytic domain-containing protein n=1 Tax=Pontibacillus litoralis JSM 072002 TaxID=1385512 RepID=A0A0A5G256_9BACI|nr:glycoside hydrolase family 13 protein [Pontibacillus litoralis]KGX86109.1 hypothetical protein N784_05975 [Pontibacillus litoralis JSM 072002]
MKQQEMYHNSFESSFREPFGAAPKGSIVSIKIDIPDHYDAQEVFLHYIYDRTEEHHKVEMTPSKRAHDYPTYEVTISMPNQPQLVWYYFEVGANQGTLYYGRVDGQVSGEGRVYTHIPPSWQITVYDPSFTTPNWWKNATMYQIFPDRFHIGKEPLVNKAPKSSLLHAHWDNEPIYIRNEAGDVVRWDFFGGNLQGIIEKLDYIASLGVHVIYLNPIFEAESNHRYDTGDYHQIDGLLGTKEDFQQLLMEARKRGIEMMLDGVFSHTGSNSIYFNREGAYHSTGAYQSKQSPYYEWYTFYNYPDEYEAWWGIDTLPTVNKNNRSYQHFMVHDEDSVIKTWQRNGMKHWRLDVADELTDDFIRQIYRQLKKENEDSVLLGEVWEDASNKTAYGQRRDYLLGGVLDSVMNYPLRKCMLDFVSNRIDAYALHRQLMTLKEHYPKSHFYSTMNLLSSHDVARIQTVLDSYLPETMTEEDRQMRLQKQVKALSLWLYAFPGVPSLYYGDEAGVTGGEDPENRKTYPWGAENQELVAWYRQLGALRNDYHVLRTGSWISRAIDSDIYGFERRIDYEQDEFGQEANNDHLVYVFNRHVQTKKITFPLRDGKWEHVLTKQVFSTIDGAITLSLSPGEGALLRYILL